LTYFFDLANRQFLASASPAAPVAAQAQPPNSTLATNLRTPHAWLPHKLVTIEA